jgi:hypothetical protein
VAYSTLVLSLPNILNSQIPFLICRILFVSISFRHLASNFAAFAFVSRRFLWFAVEKNLFDQCLARIKLALPFAKLATASAGSGALSAISNAELDELMRRVLSLLNARHLGPFEAEIHDGCLKAIAGSFASGAAPTTDSRLSPLRWLLTALQHRYTHAILRAVPVWLQAAAPSESASAVLATIDSTLSSTHLSTLFATLLKAEAARWTPTTLYQAARKVSTGTSLPTAAGAVAPAPVASGAAPAAAAAASSAAAAPVAAAIISAAIPAVAVTPGSDKSVLRALLVGAVGGSEDDALRATFGAPIMHLAAAAGDLDVVRGLIDAGVDVNAADEHGNTLLVKLVGTLQIYIIVSDVL